MTKIQNPLTVTHVPGPFVTHLPSLYRERDGVRDGHSELELGFCLEFGTWKLVLLP